MDISWRSVTTVLFAFLVVAPLAMYALVSVTSDQSPDQVRVSVDGARWTADVEDAFFDSQTQWQPGEVRTAIFWARNDAAMAVDVTLKVTCSTGQQLVEPSVLQVSVLVADGPSHTFDGDSCTNEVGGLTLKSGESATFTLRAELASDVSDAQAIDSMAAGYRVQAFGAAREEPHNSLLAATKSRLVLAPLFLGLALVVAALVIGSTRRRARDRGAENT